ncbi:hypothetical protein M569_03757 [Genlisea aurea]|uniref:Anaphase-promoting complex subunit 4 WD40 domain-containing protein n=1 Tax=Genlisea aurea TaxID=192259 RepID=S8D108_9LAMI|nr:hypothetical protein M569_03757 [Genlisea aurea]
MKRKRDEILPPPPEQRVNLEEIVGFTFRDGNGLASTASESKFAFIAGTVVVLYDFRCGTQSHFVAPTRDPKQLSCVALCSHARIIAAGETGRHSRVLVWNCITNDCISQLKGHQYGVASIALSRDGKHLISVGSARDGYVCVWDRENNVLATKFRASSVNTPISSVVFSWDAKFLVTAGKNHFKFWKVRVPAGSRTGIRSVSVIKLREFGIEKIKKEMAFVAVSCPIDHSKDAQQMQFYAVLYAWYIPTLQRSKRLSWRLTNATRYQHPQAGLLVLATMDSLSYLTLVLLYMLETCVLLKRNHVERQIMHTGNQALRLKFRVGLRSQMLSHADFYLRSSWAMVFYGDHSVHLWNIGDMSKDALVEHVLQHAQLMVIGCVSKDIASPGLRSMVVSSDGKHVAAGYFHGSINIFYVNNSDGVCIQDAHDGEIVSLSFTWESVNGTAALSEAHGGHNLLASAGIDRKIHLFDVDRNFCHLASIDYNPSAATVVKIVQKGHQMLSFGADRSLVLHSIDISDADCKISCLGRIETSGFISDMAVDHRINIAFTVCQDKKINVIDILSKRLINSFQHDGGTVEPVKIALDQSCSYLACSSANKCIRIYECMTGNLVAQATGHAAAVTGIIFLPDSVHLASVSADGCIFLWKLPPLLSSRMVQRMERVQIHLPPSADEGHSQPSSAATDSRSQVEVEMNAGFEFSLSRLPKWAQDKFIGNAPLRDVTPQRCDPAVRSPCKEASSNSISAANYSRAADKRPWQTIHTVCMDLSDSPTTSGVDIMTKFMNRGKGEEEMEAAPPNKSVEFERARSIEEELEAMEGAADNVLKSFQQQQLKEMRGRTFALDSGGWGAILADLYDRVNESVLFFDGLDRKEEGPSCSAQGVFPPGQQQQPSLVSILAGTIPCTLTPPVVWVGDLTFLFMNNITKIVLHLKVTNFVDPHYEKATEFADDSSHYLVDPHSKSSTINASHFISPWKKRVDG